MEYNTHIKQKYCGLRTSDIRALRWGQIHKDGEQWRVAVVMKKTDTPVYLPLSPQAMRWRPERGDASDDDKVFRRKTMPSTESMKSSSDGNNNRQPRHHCRGCLSLSMYD